MISASIQNQHLKKPRFTTIDNSSPLIDIYQPNIIRNTKGMGFFNNTVWFVKGLLEYTKSGYQKASKDFVAGDTAVDLSDRTIMITGANSGIGKETALEVAKKGATVYLVCRSKQRGQAALAQIKEKSKNDHLHLLLLDMSQPRQVSKFAKEFLEGNKKLDILVNNAGCMVNKRQVVQGNIEVNFATNTLGTHILTKALLPLIAKSKKPRVFIVSSGGMLTKKLDAKDLMHQQMKQDFDGTKVYAQNKRQQIVMAEYYAKNYPEIYFATMHPGWADTPGVQTSMPSFWEKMQDKLRTVQQGADTLTWMCCYKDLEKYESGSFFQDRMPVSKHLPLAWTGNSQDDVKLLMKKLDQFNEQFAK